jgi:RNA polymerase sigma factor (sigma-70 family)
MVEGANEERETARKEIIRCSLRLVLSIARRYHHLGHPLVDMLQDGSIGLIDALDRFDPGRGVRFATYATWWVRQAIERGAERSTRVVRVPIHNRDMQRQVNHARRTLQLSRGRVVTASEIAGYLGLSRRQVEAVQSWYRDTRSLDDPVELEADSVERKADRLVDDRKAHEDEREVHKAMAREVERVLGALPPRHALVLRLRFGFDGGGGRSLQQIGRELGVTRERVRQIERSAMKRLKPHCQQQDLALFLDGHPVPHSARPWLRAGPQPLRAAREPKAPTEGPTHRPTVGLTGSVPHETIH